MAFLTITDGVTLLAVDISVESAREAEPDRVGSTDRAFSGRWRSDVSAEFRKFDLLAPRMTAADFATLKALTARDRLVTVAGDAIGGAGITAMVRLTDVPYQDDITDTVAAVDFTRSVQLSIQEG